MRASSAFSMYGLVTSRNALAAESCAAIFATRVLRWTCTARYHNEATTPNAPIACAIALIPSQFIRCRCCESLRLVRDFQHNFTASVSSRGLLLRFDRVGERKSLRDDDPDFFCIDQFSDLSQLFGVRFHRNRFSADPALVELGLINIGDESRNEAAFFHDTVRSSQGIAADRVQYNIDILRDVFEFLCLVIDRDIGAEFLEQILVRG